MQSYKRKITYFYQYHNGNVGTTAGFLKLEIRGDKVKIIINIQEAPGLPFGQAALYFYHEAGDHLAAVKVDEIKSQEGVLAYQNRTDWQQVFDTGRDLYTFDGVAVVYNDDHYYIGDFQDKDRKSYELVKKEPEKEKPKVRVVEIPQIAYMGPEEEKDTEETKDMDVTEQSVTEMTEADSTGNLESTAQPEPVERKEEAKPDVFEQCENCPYQKKRTEFHEEVDAFEKMIQEYPKLPMYGATELFDCVRIHPRDIGKLDMRNWKLGVNSFLTHGFYTYQYLLLGKMRFDNGAERSIIGVPGVYSNREKYLANMFGFEQFIPVKKTGVKTGAFGYWIVEIQSIL